jgi:hypothetical protein
MTPRLYEWPVSPEIREICIATAPSPTSLYWDLAVVVPPGQTQRGATRITAVAAETTDEDRLMQGLADRW